MLLQYYLLLARSGLVNIQSAAPDLTTKLKCLKEYRARWQTLEWVVSYSFPLDTNRLWELSGGVFAQSEEASTISFRQLMSVSSSQDMQQWSIETNVPMKDFGFDLPSELVVLVHEIRRSVTTETKSAEVLIHIFCSDIIFSICRNQLAVHLRSIWNGDAHPRAAHSILYHDVTHRGFLYDIQVHEALLVILIRVITGDLNELVIWNWESGRKLLVSISLFFECC